MRLAAWISAHYLAPPAITLRAMLPPALLERLELVAERRPGGPGDAAGDGRADPADAAILESLDAGPRAGRLITAPEGRPALLRRPRALEAAGQLDLDWTLLSAGAGPRYVRQVRLVPEPAAGTTAPRLGPRQLAALEELRNAG